MKIKSYPLNITRHIDVNFRNYALYVLENRGIPSFYDALTNVQRFIILNAPYNFNKTISLVGSCISDGYHHGDKSLTSAINKLARPFGNSEQLLLGDGFFGTPINHEASAARYTSIKINPEISQMIKKSNFLNHKNEEGAWDPLWVDLPIGITNMIIGIAVGYKTTILPRNLSDIEKYLNKEITEIIPYFKNFNGSVKRYKGMDKTWLIDGVIHVDETLKTIRITEIPPLMKYGSFLKKLELIIEKFPVKMINNSSTNIDIVLKFNGRGEEWDSLIELISKSVKMLVTETPVFVKDGLVIEYERIEDYIDDYRFRLGDLKVKRLTHFKQLNDDELLFMIYKQKYLSYMIETGKMRAEDEVSKFLSELTKDHPHITRRLESILLKSFTKDELKRTEENIDKLKRELIKQEKELQKAIKDFQKLEDTSLKRSTQNRSVSSVNLFSEEEDIDGIELFQQKNEDTHENEPEEI